MPKKLYLATIAMMVGLVATAAMGPAQPLSPIVAAGFSEGDPPVIVPNTECGADQQEFTQDSPLIGQGTSTQMAYRANRQAANSIINQLGALSGVVCKICEGGVQCEREVKIDPADLSNPPAVWDPIDQLWKATATYSGGTYRVKCHDC